MNLKYFMNMNKCQSHLPRGIYSTILHVKSATLYKYYIFIIYIYMHVCVCVCSIYKLGKEIDNNSKLEQVSKYTAVQVL